jgi:hypothetical protein
MRRVFLRQLAVAGLAVVVAALSAHSAARAYWRSLPAPVVPSQAAQAPWIRLIALGPAAPGAAQARSAARAALRGNALDPAALARLGASILGEDLARGGSLLALAERVSRRNAETQLKSIELGVRRGDVPAVARHYDRTMVVHPETIPHLVPILARGLPDPGIRAALVPYARRAWFRSFVDAGLGSGADPVALVALIGAAGDGMGRENLRRSAALLSAGLLRGGHIAELRGLLRALPPSISAPGDSFELPKTAFEHAIVGADWFLTNDARVQALPLQERALELRIAPEQRHPAAERVTMLEPGQYMLLQRIDRGDNAPLAELTWDLACPAGGTARIGPPQPAIPYAVQTIAVAIPPGCPVQRWVLTATGARAQEPSRAILSGLSLMRAKA